MPVSGSHGLRVFAVTRGLGETERDPVGYSECYQATCHRNPGIEMSTLDACATYMLDAIAYRRASAPQLFSLTVSLNISIIQQLAWFGSQINKSVF